MFEFLDHVQAPIEASVVYSELETNFPYFKNLTPPLKQRFIQRLAFYLREKKFIARQGLAMTPQVRILIAACAVQITLGLDSYALDNFEYIVVYPDVYESPLTKKMYKGETNLNGFICLSWKHVWDGIKNPDDNYNLGIHEWMHALRFNGINFSETDYFFDGYINKWVAGAMPEYNKLRAGRKSIFRRYGAANIHEFLSVSAEHFFESPDEFKKEAPEFFDEMCILLNQLPDKTNSVKIGVRLALLNAGAKIGTTGPPLMTLEASFWRTLGNFGIRLLYVAVGVMVLMMAQNIFSYIVIGMIFLFAVIKMNNMYFTVKFFDDHVYVQKGFATMFSTHIDISYRSLMKIQLFHGNFDNYTTATVFQFNFYDGSRFQQKIAYCSAADFSTKELVGLLQRKKVIILLP